MTFYLRCGVCDDRFFSTTSYVFIRSRPSLPHLMNEPDPGISFAQLHVSDSLFFDFDLFCVIPSVFRRARDGPWLRYCLPVIEHQWSSSPRVLCQSFFDVFFFFYLSWRVERILLFSYVTAACNDRPPSKSYQVCERPALVSSPHPQIEFDFSLSSLTDVRLFCIEVLFLAPMLHWSDALARSVVVLLSSDSPPKWFPLLLSFSRFMF